MSHDMFEQANRLWFREGRTARALAAYEAALQRAPHDPVLAFQFARALWAVDRFAEARDMLERALTRRGNLDPAWQDLLLEWRGEFSAGPPERYFPELPPSLLDRDLLEKEPAPVNDWRAVADAAAAREMYGLAAYALKRWEGVPIDAEEARDIDRIHTKRAADEGMIRQMLVERGGAAGRLQRNGDAADAQIGSAAESGQAYRSEAAESSPRQQGGAGQSSRAGHAAPPAQTPAGATPPLPLLPLKFDVAAHPADGPVGIETTLTATLANLTDSIQGVNSRMLLNRVGAPGEIWLHVQGPEGYRNMRGFRVNAGRTPAEFFVPLAPGDEVTQSWRLNDYQSLHLPGEYQVVITYHNELERAPDGRPMATGKVVGSTSFRRVE